MLQPTHNHLPELRRRLEAGWHVEEPLLQRSVLHGIDGRRAVIEVVICRDGERSVLALCDDPDVQHFVGEHRFDILHV
jgi:hypothetical protein